MTEREKFYRAIDNIEDVARNFGLDFFTTHFKLVPATKMYEFGAYGIPGRFSHWTFGKNYWMMKTMYDYGLSKIYELVINANPSLAYCMETNALVANMTVVGHVLGHTDFFKNNIWFEHTDRQMPDTVTVHAERMREFTKETSEDEVEDWQDHVLAIQMHFCTTPAEFNRSTAQEYVKQSREESKNKQKIKQTPTTPYDDIWDLGKVKEEKVEEVKVTIPYEEESDLLWLISEFSPNNLADWQKDILLMVRNEQQYFLPQIQTKLMNEGWAAYWHHKIMQKLLDMDKLSQDDWIRFAKMHAGVIAAHRNNLNPYNVGMKIFEDIDRKHKGIPHPEGAVEKNWLGEELDPKETIGNPKYDIFQVRRDYNDKWFMRDFLPDYLIEELGLYQYELQDDGKWVITEKDPEKIRFTIAEQLTNFGRPVIYVPVDGVDYNQKRELYLKHAYQNDREIKIDFAQKALQHVYALWGRPVHLETVLNKKKILLTYDGKTQSSKSI
ncbi:SpoVR family protein [Candidatus Daviesbacteria bacterium]|nr:SpoVR family protein [Candidatus Daviesbacteria bacterium]